jgi:hypothetical protein
MEKYVMWQGQIKKVVVADGEEFNPNDHIPDEEGFAASDLASLSNSLPADEDEIKNPLLELTADLLTDDNPHEIGSKSWYKYELNSFEGVDYKDVNTVERLKALLIKTHGLD